MTWGDRFLACSVMVLVATWILPPVPRFHGPPTRWQWHLYGVRAIAGLCLWVASCAALCSGCSLQWKNMRASESLAMVEQQAQCARLDARQMGWNVASIALGGISGASGLASIVVSDNQAVVYSMGGVSLGVTVMGAISAYLAAQYTQRFCRQCANIVPPR